MEQVSTFTPEILKQLPSAVVMAGIECSGKTTFCKTRLSAIGYRSISIDDERRKILSSEEVHHEITILLQEEKTSRLRGREHFINLIEEKSLVEGVSHMVGILKAGGKASLDGIHITGDTRRFIVAALRKAGISVVACIWMNTPVDECIKRLQGRETSNPSLRLAGVLQHASLFVPPSTNEGFDLVVEVPFVNKLRK